MSKGTVLIKKRTQSKLSEQKLHYRWPLCYLNLTKYVNANITNDNSINTTDNHVVLFIYKRINDRVTHTTMRTQLRLDFRDFSYSVSSTDG